MIGMRNGLRALIFSAVILWTGMTTVTADVLRDHLSLFFEFNALDSVVALEQKSATTLQITVADGATGGTRNMREEVGAKPMQKLLSEANDLGLKTLPLTGTPSEKPAKAKPTTVQAKAKAKPVAKKAGAGHSVSSQRKNRMWYIATQSAISTYIYGISIPLALEVESPKVQFATPMIVAPFAFGAHFWYAKNRPFEDAHRKGTSYLTLSSLYASYALPYSMMGYDNKPYRAASFLTIATYPLGIWAGYKLGEKYVELPGRIDTQEKFAIGLGAMGFLSPFLYYSDPGPHINTVFRLALGQSVAMATLGHFLADHYRSGENIPTGVNTGIMDHTVLGVGVGLEVAALADAENPRPWVGAALLGGTLGFMEGLYYYRKSYDSQERGLYNTLGGLGGLLMGGGMAYLFTDENASGYAIKTTVTSLLVGGTLIGYAATNFLTQGMEDRTGMRDNPSWTDRLAFNPIPIPEPQVRDREVYLRYHMPGLTYRF